MTIDHVEEMEVEGRWRWRVDDGWGLGVGGGGRWWLVGGGVRGQIYFLSTWVFLEHSGSKTAEIKTFVAGGLTKFPHLWFSWKADCVSGVIIIT